jgi:hypothetical protein
VLRDPSYAADNVNLLPDGETLLVSREETTRLDLWSLSSMDVTREVALTVD